MIEGSSWNSAGFKATVDRSLQSRDNGTARIQVDSAPRMPGVFGGTFMLATARSNHRITVPPSVLTRRTA